MDLVEKAAQRLAQLKKAGVDVPETEATTAAPATPGTAHSDPIPTPERLAQAMERMQPSAAVTASPSPATASAATARARQTKAAAEVSSRSKVVHIDLEALAAAGFVTPEAQRSQIADEFRVVKRPIIRNARERTGASADRANLVMVTSAMPREGKSFVAFNLAMSIALEVDSTVLLVDADVANPNLLQMVHLPPSKGLLDLLTSPDTKLADVLLRTNVEKLSLLPSGTPHRRATEMLASVSMAQLLEEMASRYQDRILIFDSPPLLATTEARVLASHMGQILMVVEADRTTQAMVKHALETIEGCPVVMMMLNKAAHSEVGSYYGYGYSASSPAP